MQENKTLVNKAMKAMLVAGFFAAMCPTSAFAADAQTTNYAAAAQQNQIKGTVVDEFGEPMIGVTIKVKGAQVAGITDIDGNFALNTSEGADIEPAAAVAVASLIKAVEDGKVEKDATIMLNITGGGIQRIKREKSLCYLKPSAVFPIGASKDEIKAKLRENLA